MTRPKKIVGGIIDLFSGDIIIKKGWDRYIWFIVYLFFLVILYMTWGLYVEDKMAQTRKNEAIIEELKIEYYRNELELTSLNKKTRIEELLIKNGNKKLQPPVEPPTILVVEK